MPREQSFEKIGMDLMSTDRKTIFSYFGLKTYAAVAAPLFFLFDFLTPVVQTAFGNNAGFLSAWVLVGLGLIGLLIPRKICLSIEPSVQDKELVAFRQFSGLALATGGLWVVLSSSVLGAEAKENGVIGALFPQVEEYQTRLFGSLEDIEAVLEQTKEGVDTLVTYAEEDRADPNVQLAKRGIQRTEAEFGRALRRKDIDVVRMFVEGGGQLRPAGWSCLPAVVSSLGKSSIFGLRTSQNCSWIIAINWTRRFVGQQFGISFLMAVRARETLPVAISNGWPTTDRVLNF
ncbi:hypothetical protein [Phaeobacter sp. J2-8]|uniref:hypothetical protein n=1 Tax=Phaeobacter sp. J2-8 TaxID=2931394 RepID=UPI001FD4FC7A|nr:hypothetical protein [Phaeobacter sp. J2-8]MCJ7872995.1 hypothetical protein [Phaeobacter sp. J2-8]